jgi:hypothetical protein
MSFSEFFARLRRYNENAAVIFDHAEPIGQATDLVMPRRRWLESPVSRCRAALRRRAQRKNLPPSQPTGAPERS